MILGLGRFLKDDINVVVRALQEQLALKIQNSTLACRLERAHQ